MKRRLFTLLMAVIMLFGTVPVEVFAQTIEEEAGDSMYFIDDSVWLPDGEEPTGEVVETGEWVKTDETATKAELVCSETEHTHTDNCPTEDAGSTCGLTEHQHTETCSVTTTLVKWVVQLKDDSFTAYADKGLPLHFFIALPGEVTKPSGQYVNYMEASWGESNSNVGTYATTDATNNAQILTEQGIRNANDESSIT